MTTTTKPVNRAALLSPHMPGGARVDKARLLKRAMRAAKACTYGVCFGCGATAHGVEPDARKYECAKCHEHRVYGAEEIVLMLSGL